MMRRVELLPASYLERRKQRQTVTGIIVVGAVLVGLLFVYWFQLGTQISDAKDELATVQQANLALQQEIDALQEFADLDQEVRDKRGALEVVMVGDVDWPAVMTEIAMVIPGEIWLESFEASAGVTEGATTVGTETAPVRINPDISFGRIAFTGRSLSMPGVAKWLIQLSKVREFEAIWLNDANSDEAASSGVEVFSFDNTVELNPRAASDRFLGGQQ